MLFCRLYRRAEHGGEFLRPQSPPESEAFERGLDQLGTLRSRLKGFEGAENHRCWQQSYGARLIHPPKRNSRKPWSKRLRRWVAGIRQIVESVYDKFFNAFGLWWERPHELSGLRARLAARVALHYFCIWLNDQLGRPLAGLRRLVGVVSSQLTPSVKTFNRPGRMGKELLISDQKPGFDFAAFKDAFERKDAERWAEFYAEDAEWIEYKSSAPPRDPVRMVGRGRIAEFIASLEKSDIEITLADEILGSERAAFSVDVTLPDGKRVFEHTIVHIEDGRIVRQVDVEAWD